MSVFFLAIAHSLRGQDAVSSARNIRRNNELSQIAASATAEHGFSFPVAVSAEVLGNFSGGTSRAVIWESLWNIGVAIDLEKAAGWTGGSMVVRALYGQGSGLTNAAVHDFNRVDADGHPPDAFEKGMAEFEGELGPAIERVKVAGTIDDENDRALILNFMCLLSLRNPQQREIARSFQERVAKHTMKLVLATPERLSLALSVSLTGAPTAFEISTAWIT